MKTLLLIVLTLFTNGILLSEVNSTQKIWRKTHFVNCTKLFLSRSDPFFYSTRRPLSTGNSAFGRVGMDEIMD